MNNLINLLEGITQRFFDRLTEEHRTFIEHNMQDKYNQLDFEEAIASIELSYEMLKHYNAFLNQEKGKRFMDSYELQSDNFQKHIDAIQNIMFKITTESLRDSGVYKKVFELNIVPSIVTGGGKSLKVQHEPFSYYYNQFKKSMVIEEQLCDELYIIGYSFRDSHINKAIMERMKIDRRKDNPIKLKIVIVDYAQNEGDKQLFVDIVNKELGVPKKLHFTTDDDRILFGGANSLSI